MRKNSYLIYLAVLGICVCEAQPVFTSSNIPIIIINTNQQDIRDDIRIIAEMGIINNPGQRNNIDDPCNNYNGRIAIELRGSSSSAYPKKQYRFETQDSTGNNLNTSLLGLPAENDWILYGPYNDQSLIRNVLAYKISNQIGQYASRTRYCEVMLNDQYQGLYVLLETIKRDDNRVNIAKLTENDISGDQLTGGYIIKVDKIEGESTEHWSSPYGTSYQYHYPKYDDLQSQQSAYIRDFMASFENVMQNPDFNDPVNGYSTYINENSFIDHFIINEYAKNVDAYRISAFLHKDKDSKDPRLCAGPVWDFNLSFGKAWFSEDLFLSEGWQVDYSIYRPWDSYKVPFWWQTLFHDEQFKNKLAARWQNLRQNFLSIDNVFSLIDSFVDEIAEARERNFQKWPETAAVHSYEYEILQLKSWIKARTDWLDENINLLTSLKTEPNLALVNFSLSQNYPNPFNPKTMIKYEIAAEVNNYSPEHIVLSIYDAQGREIIKLIDQYQNAGIYNVTFDASGLASGIYYYRLKAGNQFDQSRKMIILK